MKQTACFIGSGRVTKILLQGFMNKNVNFGKIVVTDPNPEVPASLRKQFPEVEASDPCKTNQEHESQISEIYKTKLIG